MRTTRHTLRTTSTACMCVLATGFATLAAFDHGYTSPQVAVNDSGVWVTQTSNLLVGRFNHDAGALDAAVVGASTQIDVLQHDDLVVMVDSGDHTAAAVDTAAVALGKENEVAGEAADAVILEPSLAKVDELMHIGRRLRRIALQSAGGGMVLSAAGMMVAAAGFLPPLTGAILQEAIDLAAVLNALRAAFPPRVLSDY